MALDDLVAFVNQPRERAIVLLTQLLDVEERGQVRHVEIAEVVDALIEAARAPASDHTRAVQALSDDDARAAAADAFERAAARVR